MNPHLETLLMVKRLADYGQCSAATLQTMGGVSSATLKRYVRDARLLGADIVSVSRGGVPVYECRNLPVIQQRLLRWIELEQSRSLV